MATLGHIIVMYVQYVLMFNVLNRVQILYFGVTGDCIKNCPKANNYMYLSYMYINLNSC